MIRVLLVDDQSSVRYGLRLRLQLEQDLAVVGEASSGAAAVTLVETLQPDVVLLDWVMPGLAGAALISRLRATTSCAVVILSLHDSAEAAEQALAAGADAFVAKLASDELLITALHQATATPVAVNDREERKENNAK